MKNKMPKEIVDRNRWIAKQKLRELKIKIAKIEGETANGGIK
jgi:hypothetical protein